MEARGDEGSDLLSARARVDRMVNRRARESSGEALNGDVCGVWVDRMRMHHGCFVRVTGLVADDDKGLSLERLEGSIEVCVPNRRLTDSF